MVALALAEARESRVRWQAPASLPIGGFDAPATLPAARTDSELVADILGRRKGRERAKASSLLESCGGLSGLLQLDLATPRAQGLSPAEAASLLAAVELIRRLVSPPSCRDVFEDPREAGRYLYLRYASPSQEVLGAAYFDAQDRNVGEVVHFRGTRVRCIFSVRPILSEAIRREARSVLLFHNHPSGNLTPSKQDFQLTEMTRIACEAIGLELIDHLILGGGQGLSLRQLCSRYFSERDR